MNPAAEPVRIQPDDVADHPAPAPGPSAFDLLLAAGARRAVRPAPDHQRPQDWADPDPDAANKLLADLHPISRATARRRPEQHNAFRSNIRKTCERLQGLEPRTMSDDEVRAYPWHHVTPDDAAAYRRMVYGRFSNQASRNDQVVFLRSVVKACATARLISPLRRDLILDELYTAAPGRSTKRRRISDDELARLLRACSTQGAPAARARNTAVVALARTSGMRSGEIVKLHLSDWDRNEATLLLRRTKNGGNHTVFVHPDVTPLLEAWIAIRGAEPGHLFCSLNGPGIMPVSTNSLRWMLASRARTAGIDHVAWHDFRRTFATEMLRTRDHALVSRLLNHNRLTSTLVYDLADDDDQRDAIASVNLQAVSGTNASTGVEQTHD